MTRVLFVAANDWEPWGGSEELWHGAARELRRRGLDVSVSVKWFGTGVPQIQELAALGCRIHYRPRTPASALLHLVRQRMLDLAGLDYLRKADLVVISQGMNLDGLPWMQACLRRGIRYAVLAQSAAESWWPSDREAEPLAEGYSHAAMSFWVSQANLALTRRQLACELPRATVVRNPFKVSYDAPIRWPTESSDGELRFACVARLDPRSKGQDLILDVLRQPCWRARPVHVSFVGSGVAERSLRRLAQMYALSSVRFTGFTHDVAAVWATHHALLLPSRYEGLPLALVEAMLAGRPAVVTNVAGNAEVIDEGETGFLSAAPTVEHLDDAMQRAWAARESLAEMGTRAAATIRRQVPRDPAAEFADRIESLLGSGAQPFQ